MNHDLQLKTNLRIKWWMLFAGSRSPSRVPRTQAADSPLFCLVSTCAATPPQTCLVAVAGAASRDPSPSSGGAGGAAPRDPSCSSGGAGGAAAGDPSPSSGGAGGGASRDPSPSSGGAGGGVARDPSPSSPGRPGGGSRCALLRIPLVLAIGYTVMVGQAAIGFLDVTLALHLSQVRNLRIWVRNLPIWVSNLPIWVSNLPIWVFVSSVSVSVSVPSVSVSVSVLAVPCAGRAHLPHPVRSHDPPRARHRDPRRPETGTAHQGACAVQIEWSWRQHDAICSSQGEPACLNPFTNRGHRRNVLTLTSKH